MTVKQLDIILCFSSSSSSFCDIKSCALHISHFPGMLKEEKWLWKCHALRLLASTVVHVGVVFLFLRCSEIRRYDVVLWLFLFVLYFSAEAFLFLHSSLTRLFFCSLVASTSFYLLIVIQKADIHPIKIEQKFIFSLSLRRSYFFK